MAAILTNEDLIRFAQDGEDLFFLEHPCIVDRIGLSIVPGTAEYTLPDYVHAIRRITWKGRRIYPMGHRDYRDRIDYSTTPGRVDYYVFDNLNVQRIQFHKTPNENISLVNTDLYSVTDISAGVVVEFWRSPNYTSFIIPSYFRRRLLKAYVAKRGFEIEGKLQNIKNAKYYNEKWAILIRTYSELLTDLFNRPRRLVANSPRDLYARSVAAPRLSSRFGVSVDEGD